MKITILPKTKPGLWSILLSINAFILFVVGSILVFLVIPTLLTSLLSAVGVILNVFWETRY